MAPASRGTRKKIANVTTLTTNSRKTAAIRRRMMYVTIVPAVLAGGPRTLARGPPATGAFTYLLQSFLRAACVMHGYCCTPSAR